jgi:hypothetical protein
LKFQGLKTPGTNAGRFHLMPVEARFGGIGGTFPNQSQALEGYRGA